MRLIDILVRELPKRGGWCEGVISITQDIEGGLFLWKVAGATCNSQGEWRHPSGMGLLCYDPLGWSPADDQNSAIITREQYEAALASYSSQIAPMGTVGDAVAEAVSAAALRAKGGQISAGASYNLRDESQDAFAHHCQGVLGHEIPRALEKNDKIHVAISVSGSLSSSDTKNPYLREIKPGVWVDVYDVLNAWAVTNPALQHLLKKALQPGDRGHKSREQDLQDIIDSAIRAKELEISK